MAAIEPSVFTAMPSPTGSWPSAAITVCARAALVDVPNLRAVLGPPRGWDRDIHELPYLDDMDADDPRRRAYDDLRLRA